MKRILLILLCLTCWMTVLPAHADTLMDDIEQTTSIHIAVNGNVVRIVGGEEMLLEVFNVTGAKVLTRQIENNDKSFTLDLPKGCYIFKVGKVVRKFSVK